MYTFLVRLGGLFLFFKGLFDEKTRSWNKTRKTQLTKLKYGNKSVSDKSIIWIHCASSGEYQQILPVIELIKSHLPNYEILLTFFSPSGLLHVKNKNIHHIMYLPIDTKKNMLVIIQYFRPVLFIGVKYEWWWNLFEMLNKYKIPKLLVAVKFDTDHYIFKWYSHKFRNILSQNTFLLCLDEATKNAASALTIEFVKVFGDSRVDSVINRKASASFLPEEITNMIPKDKPVIIYASIYTEDLPLIRYTLSHHRDKYHLIVPHHTDPDNIAQIKNNLSIHHLLSKPLKNPLSENAMIVDSVGHLFDLYGIANFCYVGGGFTRNVHNTLEPAIHLIPICAGPKIRNFPEIEYFKANNLIHIAENPSSFSNYIFTLLPDDFTRIRSGFSLFFNQESGADKKIFEVVKNVLVS
jgi:3-deoxy-D-manno-octulosonic-acid transferase